MIKQSGAGPLRGDYRIREFMFAEFENVGVERAGNDLT